MLVAFLGFGLIGGSIARAIRVEGGSRDDRLVAWTPSGIGLAQAVADGVLDAAMPSAVGAIGGADLIVLAAPPLDCLGLLESLGGTWRAAVAPGATITDVASTKTAIVAMAATHRLPFVGGHPMAGRESSGYGAATADLFIDRPWVVVRGEDATAQNVQAVETLAIACGARPITMDAATHDAAVAGTSHLPLLLAAALVEAVVGAGAGVDRADRPFVPQLTAGGWRDMTRLARGDVAMGTGIIVTNGPALAARLRDLQVALAGWLAELERPGGPNEAAVADRLGAARERLDRLP